MMDKKIEQWNNEWSDRPIEEVLAFFAGEFEGKIGFATSLGAEDQVLTRYLSAIKPEIKIFTLDTGRLFQETYDLIQKTNARYSVNIETYFPETEEVENMTKEKGVNLFYDNIENRKLCCNIRKTKPLKRALSGLDIWISGLRREQSMTRKELKLVQWDAAYNMLKLNPLIEWTEKQTWDYIRENNVPYNALHDRNFPSIGCMPCTRAIEEGEDVRAGRWWWENPESKECGLHIQSKNSGTQV